MCLPRAMPERAKAQGRPPSTPEAPPIVAHPPRKGAATAGKAQQAPSAAEIRGIARVASAAELEHIELVQVTARRASARDHANQGELDVNVAGRHVLADAPRTLTIFLNVKLATAPATLDMQLVLELRYTLTAAVTEAEAKAFGQYNAAFNAWPYLRELVHSLSLRMGLPPLIVPLLKSSS
jgi:hypothetical protein